LIILNQDLPHDLIIAAFLLEKPALSASYSYWFFPPTFTGTMSGVEALLFISLGLRAAKLSWELYTLVKKFQGAPKIIEAHAKDLSVFGKLLGMLHTTLESNWSPLKPVMLAAW
jgi:hypothetical protein